jgi:dimethylhistidine N-methyltransferase
MPNSLPPERFRLITLGAGDYAGALARDVREGLSIEPKRIPCRYFYDREGSRLFDAICTLPEYYLTRAEAEILHAHASEVASEFCERVNVVELGSGSAVKTQILIDALLRRHGHLHYVPIDLSRTALEGSAQHMLGAYSDLHITAVVGEYHDGLRLLREGLAYQTLETEDSGLRTESSRLILWLGSNIGNLERSEAADFLWQIGATMRPYDRLLVGIDLRKDRATLERAYDDAQGITAEFNRNILARINRELGGHFDVRDFAHRAIYVEHMGRMEMYLVSMRRQVVRIDRIDLEVTFGEGEPIHTENSYKYSLDEIDTLAASAGLRIELRWLDARGWFGDVVFRAATAPRYAATALRR